MDKSRSCPADVFAKGRGPQKPSGVCLAHGNTERFPSHLPPAASLVRPTPSMQSPSYPHAVALEDIVPVERWGVQRVNRRWVLHRAGKCRRAGTQTLRDLFMRSKEAQGTGTRQEGRQLAATNRSTKKDEREPWECRLALPQWIKDGMCYSPDPDEEVWQSNVASVCQTLLLHNALHTGGCSQPTHLLRPGVGPQDPLQRICFTVVT